MIMYQLITASNAIGALVALGFLVRFLYKKEYSKFYHVYILLQCSGLLLLVLASIYMFYKEDVSWVMRLFGVVYWIKTFVFISSMKVHFEDTANNTKDALQLSDSNTRDARQLHSSNTIRAKQLSDGNAEEAQKLSDRNTVNAKKLSDDNTEEAQQLSNNNTKDAKQLSDDNAERAKHIADDRYDNK